MDRPTLTPEAAAKALGLPAERAREPLSTAQVALVLTAVRERQVKPDTVRGYLRRARIERAAGRDRPGLFPEPDGREPISDWPFWYPVTIARWQAERPGQGVGGGWPSHESVRLSSAAG